MSQLWKLIILVSAIIFLSGCREVTTATPIFVPGVLQPYHTQTPTSTPARNPFLSTAEPALPSPTPFLYTITTGDTFILIANRFGVNVEDLQAANPGILPNALTLGMTIQIPTGPVDLTMVEPTPTPVPLLVIQSHCYTVVDGGTWCFALVENPYPETLENVTAQIILLDADKETIARQVAAIPLNILPPGRSLPLIAFFAEKLPVQQLSSQVQVVTSTALLPVDLRYIPAEAQNVTVNVDWSGRSAQVTGSVALLSNDKTANQIWVVGVVYDLKGQVVGVRRLEIVENLQSGNRLPFSMEVGSLGGVIGRVDVVVEARP